jgi:hypothetical protein
VKAKAGFIGAKPVLKPPVSVKANAGFIGVKRSDRN